MSAQDIMNAKLMATMQSTGALMPIGDLTNAQKALAKAKKNIDDANEDMETTLSDVELTLLLSELEGLFGGDSALASSAALLKDLDPTQTFKQSALDVQGQFKDLLEKVKKDPTQFLPSLCVDGKISPDLVKKFCDAKLTDLRKMATPAPATTTAPLTTTEEEDDSDDTDSFSTDVNSASDSYVNMAKIIAADSANESYIQAFLANQSAEQTDYVVNQNDALIADSDKQLTDIKQQIAHIEHEQRRARHLNKTMGVLSHILSGISVALACCTMNPAIIAVTVAMTVDQEVAMGTGSRTVVNQTTAALAGALEKTGMSPQAAKVMSDVIVITLAAYAGGCAVSPGSATAMAALVSGQMLMATNLSGDTATAAIDGEHAQGTKEGSDIEIAATVLGAVMALGLTGAGGYGMMAKAGQTEMSDKLKTALTIATAAAIVSEVSLQVTTATMSGFVAEIDTANFGAEKKLDYDYADFSLLQSMIDQFSGAAEGITSSSDQQIQALATSLATLVSAVGAEYKALT